MSSGYSAAAMLKDTASWATAFAQGDTEIPIVSETISQGFAWQRSSALDGYAAQKTASIGRNLVAGDLTFNLDYTYHHMLKYAFGSYSASTYEFTNDLDAWFHLELDKVLKRYRYPSCMVNSLTITGDAGSDTPIQCTTNLVTQSETRSDTALDSYSPTWDSAYFNECILRIGNLDDALDSGDELAINSFEITVENNLETDGPQNSTTIVEPARNGFRNVMLKLGFPRYITGTNALDAFKIAGTLLQATLVITDGSSSLSFYFPEMKITEGGNWPVGGPEIITDEVTLECYRNINNTSNMASVGDQIEIVVV
jgi:hypothetical protein